MPELPVYQSPADIPYHEADAALCQRITGKKALGIAASKDRAAAFLECFSSTVRPQSAPGPTVQEYYDAYKQVSSKPTNADTYLCMLVPITAYSDRIAVPH